MKITFLGLDSVWIDELRKSGCNVHLEKVQDYIPNENVRNMFYVSPANSKGFMDGGIDKVYSQIMFPGIETYVKKNIRALDFKSKLGTSYLPIGKAILTKTNTPNKYLITSPTMLMPQDVSETRNAFYCMVGVLNLLEEMKNTFDKYKNDELIICPLCCGWGKMKPKDSAEQILEALRNTRRGVKLDYNEIIANQPKYYENTEWFDIPYDEIVTQ